MVRAEKARRNAGRNIAGKDQAQEVSAGKNYIGCWTPDDGFLLDRKIVCNLLMFRDFA